jgi:hypothetical protein
MAAATAVLLGLPLLVATGLPRIALASLGIEGGGADPVGAGPLVDHLYVYVPPLRAGSTRAIDLFTASVVAQGGHYLAVIVVLPILLGRFDAEARGLVRWPAPRLFAAFLALAGIGSLAMFLGGFAQARSFYGVAAAVHVWIEIPILILALTGGAQAVSRSPTSSETALAKSEISIA